MTLIDDFKNLQKDLAAVRAMSEENRSIIDRHEEQMNGRRGLTEAVDAVAQEIKSLRRAAYWVAGIIVAGAITFAFSVLTLIGGG